MGIALIGVAMAAPSLHEAHRKREIVKKHLNKHHETHHTNIYDVLGSMAVSGTISAVTLGLGAGVDAIAIACVEAGTEAIVIACMETGTEAVATACVGAGTEAVASACVEHGLAAASEGKVAAMADKVAIHAALDRAGLVVEHAYTDHAKEKSVRKAFKMDDLPHNSERGGGIEGSERKVFIKKG